MKYRLLQKAKEIFRIQEEKRQEFTEQYGHILPPSAVKMGGKIYSTVGNTIYKQTRDGEYTFLHMIHDHALLFFGVDYLEKEERKPIENRHPALQWMYIYADHTQKLADSASNSELPNNIGAGAAWYRFAYDLYTIRNNSKLEARLRQRLLNGSDFQSARHELWVASLFVAANFEIEYEDESDNLRTHPEFIATDRESLVKIAVEAKSKHRKGVKGFRGGPERDPAEKVDIRGLILNAYQKIIDMPYYVFMDVNLPPYDKSYCDTWMNEIDALMQDLSLEGYSDPCPANIIFFHNDPSHYLPESEIGNESDNLWMIYYESNSSKNPHPDIDVCARVMKANQQRVAPPRDFVECN